ncbi:putative serine/threonine-protein kinase [Tetrabaena socialis]|uniref:Putative serine/threonine-protein kinase n=1 Tax=Tetrabaena socialis TaxID=47790 RepID=A0A2J7ZPK9_9CHLO|nr:putative serine/threonine-protein kinase [Tetrabaena socialis]|eukprot:PNH02205.1 putative serine/threonine-protein kinase [Tetrabaena socialis]
MSAGDNKNIASGLGVALDGVGRTGSTVPSPPAQPRTSAGSRPVLSARSTGPANAGIPASGPLVASVLGSYGYRAASPGPQRAAVSQQHSSTHRSSSASMQRTPSSRRGFLERDGRERGTSSSSKPIFAAYGLQYSSNGRTSGVASGSAGSSRGPTAVSPYRTRPSSSTGPPSAGMAVAAAAARTVHELGHLLSVFSPTTPGGVPAGVKAPSSFRASKYAGGGTPHKEAWGSSGGAPEPPGGSGGGSGGVGGGGGGGGGFPRPASAASSSASAAHAKPVTAQYPGDGRHSANLSLLRLQQQQQQQQGSYGVPAGSGAGAGGMGAASLPLATQVQYQQQLLLQQQQLYQQQQLQLQQAAGMAGHGAAAAPYLHTTFITFQTPPGGGGGSGGGAHPQLQRASSNQLGIAAPAPASKELMPAGGSLPVPLGAQPQPGTAGYGGVQLYTPHQPSGLGMGRPWESGSSAAAAAAAAAQHAHAAAGGYAAAAAAAPGAFGGLNGTLGGPPSRLSSGSLPAAPAAHLLPYVSVHDSVDGAPTGGASAPVGYAAVRASVAAAAAALPQPQPYGSTMPSLAPPPPPTHTYASTAPASVSFSSAMASAAVTALQGLHPTPISSAAPAAPAPGPPAPQPPLPSLTPAPHSAPIHLHHHHNHPPSSTSPVSPTPLCVIKLFEVVESPRHLFLVMEHAPAGSLLDYVRARKRLPEADACVFFQQIVASLEYCHSREVVHRDIKLENILLDVDQRMKLIDFGLSAFFVPSKRLRVHCGSPSYAAPEIVARKAYEGPPVDVWSLGVVLFAMVAGYLPFHASGGNKQELCNKIMAGQYTAPDWLSAPMKDLLGRMLTTDPDKRITFQQVWQHSWVRTGPQWHERGVNCYEVAIDPSAPGGLRADEQVVSELEAAGYARASLAQHLATGEATHLTASYFLLCEAKADAIRRLRSGGRGGGSAGSLRSAPGSFTVAGPAPGSAAVVAAAVMARARGAGESPGRPGSSRPTTARDGPMRTAVAV